MRVAHVVPALFGSRGVVGGAERYAYELARAMAEVVPTTLISYGERGSIEQDGPLRVRVLGHTHHVRGQPFNPVSRELLRELPRYDVIHCHQQHIVSSSVSAAVGRLLQKRVFVSDLGGGGFDLSAYISTDRWYHGHLHISEYSRSVYGQTGWSRARVIYGGVDTGRFSPKNSAAPAERRVLYVGRILPHKGIDLLIRALPEELGLDVVGAVADERYLRDLHALSRGKRVRFLRDKRDEELVELYNDSLCVVLASVHRTMYGQHSLVPELLGQTLLEGMACGRPALCTRVASMPEVVRDGVTGFVVSPDDSTDLSLRLRALQGNPSSADSMGRAAREWVLSKFRWPAVVERCLRAYSELGGR